MRCKEARASATERLAKVAAALRGHDAATVCTRRNAEPDRIAALGAESSRPGWRGTGAVVLSGALGGWEGVWHGVRSVLDGMATPGVIALVLALTTLLLEDLAIAAGVALATQGALSWPVSLGAVAGGIAAGDLGLYALGFAATRIPALRRRHLGVRSQWARSHIQRQLSSTVLLARVIPGLRLLTYTTCGFVGVPLLPFTAWVVVAVTLWTTGLYVASVAIGQTLSHALGVPPAVAVALPIVALALVVPLLRSPRRSPQRITS
jgi:membrane protein DedA with SNARE-associated domain